jgi:phosphate transport system permease protein
LRKEVNLGDLIFSRSLLIVAVGIALLLGLIALFLLNQGWPAFSKFGFSFVWSSTWDPIRNIFGAFPVIFGTLVSSGIAILISAPLSIGVALFLCELAPRSLSVVVGFLVQMLAAIPSVVYGLWGIYVLAPWLRKSVEPTLQHWFGFLPLFSGPAYGVGMLAAGIVLAIMITPTIASITTEVFRAIPNQQREAALALGATRWEMMRISVLGSAKGGIFGAIILGLGRALGETMAVTMVIGNRADVSASLFAPAQTMASVIANEYAEASSGSHLSALTAVGFTLFAVTLIVNSLARVVIWRSTRKAAS